MIKRLSVLAIFLVLVWGASLAVAGEYHTAPELKCMQCHVMHSGLGPKLLAGATINDTCLACHDNNGGRDAFEAADPTKIRNAGGLNAIGNGDEPTYHSAPNGDPDTYYEDGGHTLASTDPAPGGTWAAPGNGLNCVNCHEPHGSGYRNLGGRHTYMGAALTLTYGKASSDTIANTWDVWLRADRSHLVADVDYLEPVSDDPKMSVYCASCHTQFNTGGGTKHPTKGVNVVLDNQPGGFIQPGTRLKLTDPDFDWANPDGDETPMCTTCHKAHGNKNPKGLIYGGVLASEEGEGGHDYDLCTECHVP